MWEVHFTRYTWRHRFRITPTYVGSTYAQLFRHIIIRDHPHVCGKYSPYQPKFKAVKGSPPRMWEVQGYWINFHQVIQDHPHVCGKYFKWWKIYVDIPRITPTYVGSTIGFVELIVVD